MEVVILYRVLYFLHEITGIIADYTVTVLQGSTALQLESVVVSSAFNLSSEMSVTFPFSGITSAGSLTGQRERDRRNESSMIMQ